MKFGLVFVISIRFRINVPIPILSFFEISSLRTLTVLCFYIEYKKRRSGVSQTVRTEEELTGLDALASAAALGDTLGEEEEPATTTRHPRHRVGCSCIVCIQPPSGKGRHNSSCLCTVCSTVKRRFKTLMMRRKKKQLEREEIEAAVAAAADQENKEDGKTGRIDLNSDPCNRGDVEAVGVEEKDESEKGEAGGCLGVAQADDVVGVTELEGEGEKIGEESKGSS